MSRIQAKEKSVRELLSNVKYSIDFYQREYEWERRHVEELLDDFEAKFTASFTPEHERPEVSNYPHYFLGTIITISEDGQQLIVDGQQRLTTLTLLLVYVQHQLKDIDDIGNCRTLIYSSKSGMKSFNINVPERLDCMSSLFEHGEFDAADQRDLSVKNLAARYADIVELFPESLKDDVLPYFFDWLTENVDLVDIRAYTDNDAFTIFETMNDRGLNLGQVDMRKGYLLANINSANEQWTHDKKAQANDSWKQRILEFVEIESGEEDNFFKTWLRAKYADSIRERKKGATNQDFENIDKFHRWVRDNTKRIGLESTQEFYDFITQRMNRFAGHYIMIREASQSLTLGSEEIYYNAYNNFTLQYMLALAPLKLEDDSETALRKIRLVTTFADIFLARRMVNYRRIGYNTLQYAMFNLTKKIRDLTVDALREVLQKELSNMWEDFGGVTGERHWLSPFALNNFTGRSIRYLLARMTAWIEREAGNNVNFLNFLWDAKGKPFDIEHIWASHYEKHEDEFSSEEAFQRHRNYFGGLLLLPRPINRSLQDKCYEYKLEKYREQNLLAASLNKQKYVNEPSFKQFIETSGLPFKPHAQFKRDDLMERQELYRQICEQIWNPDRLNAI